MAKLLNSLLFLGAILAIAENPPAIAANNILAFPASVFINSVKFVFFIFSSLQIF